MTLLRSFDLWDVRWLKEMFPFASHWYLEEITETLGALTLVASNINLIEVSSDLKNQQDTQTWFWLHTENTEINKAFLALSKLANDSRRIAHLFASYWDQSPWTSSCPTYNWQAMSAHYAPAAWPCWVIAGFLVNASRNICSTPHCEIPRRSLSATRNVSYMALRNSQSPRLEII